MVDLTKPWGGLTVTVGPPCPPFPSPVRIERADFARLVNAIGSEGIRENAVRWFGVTPPVGCDVRLDVSDTEAFNRNVMMLRLRWEADAIKAEKSSIIAIAQS